ncbi:hypothetical protein [Streptomyces sp. CNQ085]|uniref:hypothetical protein n=1 Tax=Streptomyces sp. CNQ085 TaxID=2886944 RepID=UPI001F50E610|nr:hypothetical protein [Streptomyces sp. CNQ085]MCI0384055.1 hypothetical protein [Streptomyces sp. CNQ085]
MCPCPCIRFGELLLDPSGQLLGDLRYACEVEFWREGARLLEREDAAERLAAPNAGLQVWGSLRVVAESVKDGRVTEYAATAFVDALLDTGIRYPFPRGGFITWAKHNSLF